MRPLLTAILPIFLAVTACSKKSEPQVLRVATFNVEDIRLDDLENPEHARLKRIAEVIHEIGPDIVLVSEVAYDMPGAPGWEEGDTPGQNAQRLAKLVNQGAKEGGLRYAGFTAPSNTGVASGFDLDNNGEAVTTYPEPEPAGANGEPGKQSAGGRAYGGDCWGFGTFPGQYGMALLVSDRLEILRDEVRTFQMLKWSAMPGALAPTDPKTGEPWYNEEEWAAFRLSSKNHWDVSVRLPDGKVVHLLCSHPTPPAFDGEEARNKKRNHDEIRFWADYIDGADYIVDDTGKKGGLPEGATFFIMGDQNADPDEGGSIDNPIKNLILDHPRVNGEFVPQGSRMIEKLSADDTSSWGMRIDYVLPSNNLRVLKGEVYRYDEMEKGEHSVSDHFPVWIDVEFP